MNMNPGHLHQWLARIAALLLVTGAAVAGEPAITSHLEPGDIALGQSSELTITTEGSNSAPITPPSIPGLEFMAIGQSTQINSVNGKTTAKSSVVYQVTPQRAGIYTIPALAPGSQPLVLQVHPGGGYGASANNSSGAPAAPASTSNGLVAGATRLAADGSAFVRLRLPTRQLYVGESVPVDIQVGLREGLVASLNGLPTLNGDAFTLNKLSSRPDQAELIVNGQPFTVLTWHSVLVAVKPGTLSLTLETPLTVRMRVNNRPAADQLGDSAIDDLFNDPFFQNFFGQTTEKDITVASAPEKFDVQALPVLNRPAGFGGAVGTFQAHSDLSAATAAAGDPLTLRLHVTGTGTFDRVSSAMLSSDDHWKTYQPTAQFSPADAAGLRGDKVFEQAVIATHPGTQIVPALPFSYFDPQLRRYVTVRTSPLSVQISPGSATSTVASAAPSSPGAGPTVPSAAPVGLRPDRAETANSMNSLVPLYFQPRYLAIPLGLALAFFGLSVVGYRREQAARDAEGIARRAAAQTMAALVERMQVAVASGDIPQFLSAARSALQQSFAARWHVKPQSITATDVETQLGAQGKDIGEIFALADQLAYSGGQLEAADLPRWQEIVLRHIPAEVRP